MSQRETDVSKLLARLAKVISVVIAWAVPATAFAQETGDPVTGQPTDGAIGFQQSVNQKDRTNADYNDGRRLGVLLEKVKDLGNFRLLQCFMFQQFFVPFRGGDIGIDADPTALRQW